MRKGFTIEKKLIVQVRFYEELFVIKNERGELIFTGTEETATSILKMLRSQAQKRAIIKIMKKKAQKRKARK